MLTIEQFLFTHEWDKIEEVWYWAQCVALVKAYTKEVLWVTLWSFWWSANNWYKNIANTFKLDMWKKIPNTPQAIPEKWSLIFFKWSNLSEYWHVAIVLYADINNITVIEQNWGNWTWTGTWADAIRTHEYNYSQVQWWMTFIEEEEQTFNEAIEEYSESNIVVLYKSKYYINLNNNRTEVNLSNYKKILW